MASTPSFIGTPRLTTVNLSAANTNIDGSETITELIAGVSTGTRVLEINHQCAATSAEALVNIFITTDGGTTWRLFDQITVTAATVSNTVKANRNIATYANLVLPNTNTRLGVTTTIAQSTNVIALAGDL